MKTWSVAHLVITDAEDTNRYSVPESATPNPKDDKTMRLDMLGFKLTDKPFGFTFSAAHDVGDVFVSTVGQSLVFMDKYIQMDFKLPSQRVFGFGERVHEFQLGEGTWTMWANAQDSPIDDGTGRYGTYGVHPFVLVQGRNPHDFFGMYFRNSNAQSPVLKYLSTGESILSYITLGGQLEVFFFIHGSAKDVIRQYHDLIGHATLPPYWAMGWQQASFKWTTQKMVENVIGTYEIENFPLDTIYLDIPYMDKYQDFTVDMGVWYDIQSLYDKLLTKHQKLVLILNGGLAFDSTDNKYYNLGNTDDVFIKSGQWKSEKYSNNLIGQVWTNQTAFIDWFNPKCMNLWATGLNDLYAKIPFNGLWLDMNEANTFSHGELKPQDAVLLTTEE